MMKMCDEMMGTMGMDGMMGGRGGDMPDDATSGEVVETEQTETKAPAKKK